MLPPMKMWSGLNQERSPAQIKRCLQAKTVLNKYVGAFWCERTAGDGHFHWRKCYYGLQKQRVVVKNVLMMDLFLTNTQLLSSQDVNWWTGVMWITCGLLWCFYQLFGLSFWRHPFTAEDPLVSKWWNAIFQIWWRNKLIYILDGLRVSTFSASFLFWVNYSFKHFLFQWAAYVGTILRHHRCTLVMKAVAKVKQHCYAYITF